jgi:hypothetical protein
MTGFISVDYSYTGNSVSILNGTSGQGSAGGSAGLPYTRPAYFPTQRALWRIRPPWVTRV